MAEPEDRLVRAYLVELRHSLAGIPTDDADEIAAEVEDHLHEATQRHGELEALARFGTPNLIAATFHKEAGKGAAVPTTFTKRAGLAAALSPVLLALGAVANQATIGRGAAHGGAVIVEAFTFPLVLLGIIGFSRRHGGFGVLGQVALAAFLMAPVFSILMPWMGIAFTGTLWTFSFALLGIAMLRAKILPRLPVVLFGFSAAATIVLAVLVTALGGDAGFVWVVPLVLQSTGFAWLGWAMWREEALATPGSGPWASAAA
jgi:hypothetical protein